MQLIDPKHKFYRPLWVRVAVVVVCASWFAVEAYVGASFWLVIVGALTVYSAYELLYRYDSTANDAPTETELASGEGRDSAPPKE